MSYRTVEGYIENTPNIKLSYEQQLIIGYYSQLSLLEKSIGASIMYVELPRIDSTNTADLEAQNPRLFVEIYTFIEDSLSALCEQECITILNGYISNLENIYSDSLKENYSTTAMVQLN